MSVEVEIGMTAAEYWRSFSTRFPITEIDTAAYMPHKHGTPSSYVPGYFDTKLPKDCPGWPYVDPRLVECRGIKMPKETTFAMGQRVLIQAISDSSHGNVAETAVLTSDFTCPISTENQIKIMQVLETKYRNAVSVLLQTDQSYHAVIEALLPVKNLPWHYGEMINTFANIEDGEAREISLYFGNELLRGYKDSIKLEKVCDVIGKKVTPADHHYLDLRWFRRSLLEFLDYDPYRGISYGFLRFSAKWGGKEPVVVAVGGPSQES